MSGRELLSGDAVPEWARGEFADREQLAGLAKVKDSGRGGVDEGEALQAAVFGPYDPKRWDREWANLGPDRVEVAHLGSKNLWLLRRVTAYIRTGGATRQRHRDALCQWLRDQLSTRNGLFDTEGGWCDYGCFDLGAISALGVFAVQRNDVELSELCRRYVGVVTGFFALAAFPGAAGQSSRDRATAALYVAPAGMRAQGLLGPVQSALLARQIGRNVDMKKIGRQPHYWTARMLDWALNAGLRLPTSLLSHCGEVVDGTAIPDPAILGRDLHVLVRLKVRRHRHGLVAAMERDGPGVQPSKGESARVWCSYGAPRYGARVTHSDLSTLEIDPKRAARPGICSALPSEDGSQFTVSCRHESDGFEGWRHLATGTAELGELLWSAELGPGLPLDVR